MRLTLSPSRHSHGTDTRCVIGSRIRVPFTQQRWCQILLVPDVPVETVVVRWQEMINDDYTIVCCIMIRLFAERMRQGCWCST